MAISLVSAGSVVASGTPAFGQATTSGSLLVCFFSLAGSTATTEPGWVTALGPFQNGVAIAYKPNCAAGETAPVFGYGTTGWLMLAEFSGVDTAPLENTDVATSGSISSPTTFAAAAADAAVGNLVVTADGVHLSKAGTHTSTDTYNNGATSTALANNDAISGIDHYRFAYGVPTGNSVAQSNTLASNSKNLSSMGCALATFKAASGGSTYTKAGFGNEHG